MATLGVQTSPNHARSRGWRSCDGALGRGQGRDCSPPGVALLQPQFRFVVVHSLAVVLHVPQSGSQGHVDGQLGPWPVEQLRKVQLGGDSHHEARAVLPPAARHPPRPLGTHLLLVGCSGLGESHLPWRTGPWLLTQMPMATSEVLSSRLF